MYKDKPCHTGLNWYTKDLVAIKENRRGVKDWSSLHFPFLIGYFMKAHSWAVVYTDRTSSTLTHTNIVVLSVWTREL
jgi:hypothetical protein